MMIIFVIAINGYYMVLDGIGWIIMWKENKFTLQYNIHIFGIGMVLSTTNRSIFYSFKDRKDKNIGIALQVMLKFILTQCKCFLCFGIYIDIRNS